MTPTGPRSHAVPLAHDPTCGRRPTAHGGFCDHRGVADELGEVADALYALSLDDFITERDGFVKRLRGKGDRDLARQVAALPKPSVAAWLLNQLARRRTDAVEQLVDLGDELRTAQQRLDGDQLRALGRRRQQVVRAFSRQVAQLADELGRSLSGTVAQQVDETLRAAVAHEDAGHALLSGRLTTALTYSGMGEVNLSAAVAVPSARGAGPARNRRSTGTARATPAAEADAAAAGDDLAVARERRLEAARAALAQAEQASEDAAAAVARHEQELAALAERRSGLEQRLEELRAERSRIETQALDLEVEQQQVQEQRHAADEAAHEASRAAERAHQELDGHTGRAKRRGGR